MSNKPTLIVIDDEAESAILAAEIAPSLTVFSFDEDLSKTIQGPVEFNRLEAFLSTTDQQLALIVDPGLSLDETEQVRIRAKYPNFADLNKTMLEGVCLASAAIANRNRRELLIVITSQRAIEPALITGLRNAKDASSNAATAWIKAYSGLQPFLTRDPERANRLSNARSILDEAAKLWEAMIAPPKPTIGPIEQLAKDFWEVKQRHPNTPHQVDSECLRDVWEDALNLHSFTALYWIDEGSLKNFKFAEQFAEQKRRFCLVAVLQRVFAFLGVKLGLTNITPTDSLQLPIQPGLLFVLNLAEFLEHMEVPELTLGRAEDGVIEMRASLKYPDKFKSAVVTGTGREGLGRFQRLMACRHDVIIKYVDQAEAEKKIRREWPPRPFLETKPDENTHVYRALLDWEVSLADKCVILRWQTEQKPRP